MPHVSTRITDDLNDEMEDTIEEEPAFDSRAQFLRYAIRIAVAKDEHVRRDKYDRY